MRDTTDEMAQKQREILFNKTPEERFIIGAQMIDSGRLIVESSIKQEFPDISEIDLKIAVFKRYYKNDFSNSEIEKIISSMRTHYLKNSDPNEPT